VLEDPFRTAALRARVLDAWAASPARFREDANAEEDYALGGYRDRVVVELAQNAADAAARAGVPGRLRLTLRDGTLVAANTGAPLDAAGVEALSTLRASSKRDESTTGRFGVGFAAAVSVSDTPGIRSATGAVRWSREDSRELVEQVPALAAELAARSAHVPVLRLPFPSDGTLPDGFTTAVTLPLRDDEAVALAERLLAETGPALLIALPMLAEIVIEAGAGTRVLTAEHSARGTVITVDGVSSRWRTATDSGLLDPRLLADRPVEERGRPSWSVRWAVPVNDDGAPQPLPANVQNVVHAPTPTHEPLDLPALLLASFPLSPDRRHVAQGPLTTFLTGQAASVYAHLLPELAPGPGLLDLVPGAVARGELGNHLSQAIRAVLPSVPFLPAAGASPGARVRPRDALLITADLPGLADFLAPVFPGLISGPARHPGYALLGVRSLPLAELADSLAALDRPPSWWRDLYDALAAADPGQRAELGALPVPLADGRLIRGPRGLLLPVPGLKQPVRLSVLGLRVVHPDAAHPLLAALGAVEATPRSVLADPATRAAVEASYEETDPMPIADAVLGLAADANVRSGEMPWLAGLTLPGDDGEWYAADELLLPHGPLAGVVAADAPFGIVSEELAGRYDATVLEAAGVLSSFGLLTEVDVDLGEPGLDLDGAAGWSAQTRTRLGNPDVPPFAPQVVAVRDLELVDQARWPQALELLTQPPLRAALVEPTRVMMADGRYEDVPSYTAWWLRNHMTLAGRRTTELRAIDADPLLAGLYDEADPAMAASLADPVVARAVGVRTGLADLLAEPGGPDELLARLADPARSVTRAQLTGVWTALATAGLTPEDITPPDQVRAVRGADVIVASADQTLVLDAADLWPLVSDEPLVLAPRELTEHLADLLGLPLVSEEVPGDVETEGQLRPVPDIMHAVLPDAPAEYVAHDKLLVDGVEVAWRYHHGAVHATDPAGLASGLAWAVGRWQLRHLLAALLSGPQDTARLLADFDLDPPP
jgi:hypothetical protein